MRKSLFGALIVGAVIIGNSGQASASETTSSGFFAGSQCVVLLEADQAPGPPKNDFVGCFGTGLAADAATAEAVEDRAQENLRESRKKAGPSQHRIIGEPGDPDEPERAGSKVLGYDYPYPNYYYNGSSSTQPIIWRVTHACDTDHTYSVPSITDQMHNPNWNDSISSAYATAPGNCDNFNHFEHEGYGGLKISCGIGRAHSGCETMGAMANETSSLRFRP